MRFARDEEGVSVVVGAVLVFGLIIMTLVTVQVSYVPVWEEDAEASRAELVQGQLIGIKAEADRQVDNRTSGGVALPLQLGESRSSRIFRPITLPGQLEFDPTGTQVGLSSNLLLIQIQDDLSLAGVNENWVTITTGDAIIDISQVQHLRIRISDPESGNAGDSVTLTVTDGNGDFAGDISVYKSEYPSGYAINTRVRDASGTIRYDQGESQFQQAQPAFYWVNALADENQFRTVLAAADKPITLTLNEDGYQGEYAVQYVQTVGGGGVTQGSSGKEVENYTALYTGGHLSFDTQNIYFLDQEYILEYGAILIVQDDGVAVVSGPTFDVDRFGSVTRVALTLPHLTGDSESRSGSGTATLLLRGESGSSFTALAPSFVINQTTAYPSAWADWWKIKMQESGLSSLAGHYTITQGADWAQLAIYGTTPDPASEEYDLSVILKQSTVRVKIQT